ncbi:MAG: hypothetical protein GY753_09070, partial [Gammaproteobacteria bacterium]|nr:hypothetical protein [Gammaproteobacteria bacterium]
MLAAEAESAVAAPASSLRERREVLAQEQEEEPAPETKIDIASVPLYFVANQGQVNQDVRMHGKGAGGAGLYFTRKEVVLVLPPPIDIPEEPLPGEEPVEPPEPTEPAQVLRMRFGQANSQPEIEAVEPLSTKVNYLLGDDPGAWQTGLSTYGAIVYHDLYEGIDLRYEGQGKHLKGAWVVEPGADPSDILWQYVGAKEVDVEESTGNLLITMAKPTGTGEPGEGPEREPVMEMAPVAWQEINEVQVAVDVQFDVGNNKKVGFSLGNYDAAYPLIIDPTLDYNTYLGGSSTDYGRAVATDAEGNAYVAGYTYSYDFPQQNSSTTWGGDYDVFVSKLISDTTLSLAFSSYLGGSSSDYGYDIALGGDSRIYVTGYTNSKGFPKVNAYDGALSGTEGFLTVLSNDGLTTHYSTYLGGTGYDYGHGVAIDADNNAYVAG